MKKLFCLIWLWVHPLGLAENISDKQQSKSPKNLRDHLILAFQNHKQHLDASMSKHMEEKTRLCRQNKGEECYDLGKIHANVTKSRGLAIPYYVKACSLKIGQSCSDLGFIHSDSEEFQLAADFYQKSCKLGDTYDCYLTAYLYFEHSLEIKPSLEAFLGSCEYDEGYGCYEAAKILAGTPGNQEKVKQFLEKACLWDVEAACEMKDKDLLPKERNLQ